MVEQKIEVMFEGKKVELTLRRLTWGQINESVRKSITYINGKKEIDVMLQKELQVVYSIKNAPFTVNLDNVRKLDWKDGERLDEAFQKLNNAEPEVG